MTAHVTNAELEDFRRGTLPPADVLVVARHLSGCMECRKRANVDADRAAQPFRDAIGEDEHRRDLEAYAARRLSRERIDVIAEHLAACTICREDLDDLQPRRGIRNVAWLAAAASIAGVIALGLLHERTPDPPLTDTASPVAIETGAPPPQPRYARREWQQLIDDARAGRMPESAILDQLRPPASILRGTATPSAATLRPAGEVVEETRPRFGWPDTPGARYVVSVYAGDEEIARSKPLAKNQWTPHRAMPRDTTLAWQVEVLRDGAVETILPAPPAPPALFRIVSAAGARELDEARRAHPHDAELHAALAAKYGIVK